MPIFLKPNQRFPIVLECDMNEPTETRPTFYAVSVNMEKQVEMADAVDAVYKDVKSTNEITELTATLLNKYLVDFKNMGEFKFGDDVRKFLSNQEAMELLRKIMANNHVQNEEKKS